MTSDDKSLGRDQEPSDLDNSRREFIAYLDSETDNLRSEIQRPGWTNWALLGSIATFLWLLLSQIEDVTFSPKHVCGILLVLTLIALFILLLSVVLYSPDKTTRKRFYSNELFNKNKSTISLLILSFFFGIFAAYYLKEDIATFVTILTYIVFSLLVFEIIGVLVITKQGLHVAKHPRGWKIGKRFNIILSIILLVLIWQYISLLTQLDSRITVSEIRISLLIGGIYFLTFLYFRTSGGSMILDSLIATRRDFYLGHLDLNTAIRQADIALTGLQLADVLEEDVNKLLALYRECSTEAQKASYYLEEARKLYVDKGAQHSLARPLLVSALSSVNRVEKIGGEDIPEAFRLLKNRMVYFEAQIDIADVVEDLNLKLFAARNEFKQHISELRAKVKTLFPETGQM